jgi:hypothetical protein
MTQGEINDTTADPFCGFNLGSTVYRATPDKARPPRKFIFESPVVRLGSDFGYRDVFENGKDIVDPDWDGTIPLQSIVIYHYYDPASTLLGTGKTPEIETFAKGLSDLILRVRDFVCNNPKNQMIQDEFRCYLVAHSMGGLVCRAFLQNPALGEDKARKCVDKVFTYATPHNGIEVGGINVPSWLGANDINNFSRERMAKYLDLEGLFKKTQRVDWLPERVFPSDRFFCMIGTNRSDYEVALGISRTFAGHGSDGLVRIDNASVWGTDKEGKFTKPCPTAYTYRSHSGYFGIVNSEEAYQNLTRFLFGDVRVDISVEVTDVRLPKELQKEDPKKVDGLYQFEVLAATRGMRWHLTRRVSEEDSVACRSHQDIMAGKKEIYLSTVFLANRARVNTRRRSLAYSLALGVRIPDYEVDRKLWFDKHYEGGHLFRDSVIVELTPPREEGGEWKVSYGWQSKNPSEATKSLSAKSLSEGRVELVVPFDGGKVPGLEGKLKFVVSGWN